MSDDIFIDIKWISAVKYSELQMFLHPVGPLCDLLESTGQYLPLNDDDKLSNPD